MSSENAKHWALWALAKARTTIPCPRLLAAGRKLHSYRAREQALFRTAVDIAQAHDCVKFDEMEKHLPVLRAEASSEISMCD